MSDPEITDNELDQLKEALAIAVHNAEILLGRAVTSKNNELRAIYEKDLRTVHNALDILDKF